MHLGVCLMTRPLTRRVTGMNQHGRPVFNHLSSSLYHSCSSSSLLFHSSRPYHCCDQGPGPGSTAAAETGAEGTSKQLGGKATASATAAGGCRRMNSTPRDQSALGATADHLSPAARYTAPPRSASHHHLPYVATYTGREGRVRAERGGKHEHVRLPKRAGEDENVLIVFTVV